MPDDPKSKDRWDKAAIVGNLLSAMILPFALLAAGHFLNQAATLREQIRRDAERQAEEDRVRLDRANGLLESLASESGRRRRVAVEWAKYLERIKQLPPEATTVLLELALTDTDTEVARVASTVAASVAEGDAAFREVAAARFARNPELVQRFNVIADVVNAQVKGG